MLRFSALKTKFSFNEKLNCPYFLPTSALVCKKMLVFEKKNLYVSILSSVGSAYPFSKIVG